MTTEAITSQSDSLVRALKRHGAPGHAKALILGGQADLGEAVARLLKPGTLAVRQGENAFDLTDETSSYGLVIAAEGLECAALAGLRARMQAIAGILTPGGRLALWISTLASLDDEAAGHEALLFPFSAASGALGPSAAATTPLSASSWTLLALAAGFEILACDGFGRQPLPVYLADHADRLSIYDDRELATGRLLMVLQKGEKA